MRKADIKVGETYSVFGFHEEGLSVEAAVIKEVGKGWWEVKLPSGEKAQVHSKSLEQAMAKEKEKAKGPQKKCVKCGKGMHARCKVCPHCEADQPKKEKAPPAHMNLGDIEQSRQRKRHKLMWDDLEPAQIGAALQFLQWFEYDWRKAVDTLHLVKQEGRAMFGAGKREE